MSTTALFVELLVIGFESLLWVFLLTVVVYGKDVVFLIRDAFLAANLFVTAVIISLSYLLGIVFDEISDFLTEKWASKIRSSVHEKNLPEMWDIQAYIFSHSLHASEKLDYMRSRIRILRASIFNVALIFVFGLVLIHTRPELIPNGLKSTLDWSIVIFGIVCVSGVAFTYWRITRAYWLRAISIYKSLSIDEE
ncbi:MAG: hypothetical protein GXO35_00170 [Gammaproteobacteria bacterium]|nr:hypothetical protein [Gammaproteobacteria bacterium]